MPNQLKLTVDQIIAAIGLLDDEEQAQLRPDVIAWLAGAAPVAPTHPTRAASPERPLPGSWLAADIVAEEEELYLFDELMLLGDE